MLLMFYLFTLQQSDLQLPDVSAANDLSNCDAPHLVNDGGGDTDCAADDDEDVDAGEHRNAAIDGGDSEIATSLHRRPLSDDASAVSRLRFSLTPPSHSPASSIKRPILAPPALHDNHQQLHRYRSHHQSPPPPPPYWQSSTPPSTWRAVGVSPCRYKNGSN